MVAPLLVFAIGNESRGDDALAPLLLRQLHTDYLDVVTFYYVEAADEWEQIIGPGGALEYCRRAQEQGCCEDRSHEWSRTERPGHHADQARQDRRGTL